MENIWKIMIIWKYFHLFSIITFFFIVENTYIWVPTFAKHEAVHKVHVWNYLYSHLVPQNFWGGLQEKQ